MSAFVRRQLINLDIRAGRWLALQLPAYIEERWNAQRQGTYTAEEWSRARAAGYRGNDAANPLLDSEEGYRRQLLTHNAPAVGATHRLTKWIDFRHHRSVLEIGCGEMAQALTLVTAHPHLRYRATDFDPFVIEKCSRLPLLHQIEKGLLDVSRITPDDLRGFDLLIGWEIIYAFDDRLLDTVLRAAATARVPFLAVTSQLLGPVRYLRRTWRDTAWGLRASRFAQLAAAGRIRAHGWNPSLGHYRRAAAQAGMRLSRTCLPPPDATDSLTFLLFEPV